MKTWEALFALPVANLLLKMTPEDCGVLEERWWGSTLRGALGAALRFLLCRCRGGVHRPGCDFARLFAPATEEGNDSGFLPPWRLVINLRESHLEVQIRLFGEAVAFADAFQLALQIAAFRGLGQQRFSVTVVEKQHTTFEAQKACPWTSDLSLLLLSPVRLQDRGALVTVAPSFLQVFSSAQRKLRLAARSWCGVELPYPSDQMHLARHVAIAAASVSWMEKQRFSHRQKRLMRLGGLVGFVQFAGEWSFAWPWLRFLPALGLGKLTTMGFGDVSWGHTAQIRT